MTDAERSGHPTEVATLETIIEHGRYGIRRPEIGSARHCWSYNYITCLIYFDFEWILWYKKVIRQMDAAFAHKCSQTQSCDKFKEGFGIIQPQSGRVLASFHSRTWIHLGAPETKQLLEQCVSPGESAPKGANVFLSANKILMTVSWDARLAFHINFFQKRRKINS